MDRCGCRNFEPFIILTNAITDFIVKPDALIDREAVLSHQNLGHGQHYLTS
jgi:hypothetical protein